MAAASWAMVGEKVSIALRILAYQLLGLGMGQRS